LISLRRKYFFTFLFPSIYIIAAAILSGPFGGAGHGWGVGAFLDISMPAGLIGFLVVSIIPVEWLLVPIVFLAALVQYALLGYLLDRFLKSRRER